MTYCFSCGYCSEDEVERLRSLTYCGELRMMSTILTLSMPARFAASSFALLDRDRLLSLPLSIEPSKPERA